MARKKAGEEAPEQRATQLPSRTHCNHP